MKKTKSEERICPWCKHETVMKLCKCSFIGK